MASKYAEALFQEGKALFDAGQFERACAKFAASQELDAGFGTLFEDAARLYVWIRAEDLAVGRFDRVRAFLR